MIGFIIYYIIYNLVVGNILAIAYSKKRRGLQNEPGYYSLPFWPVTGLGKWKYMQAVKEGITPRHTESWYKWRYMYMLHLGFVPAFIFLNAIFPFSSSGGGGHYRSSGSAGELLGNTLETGAGLAGDVLSGIGSMLLYTLLFLAMILIPALLAKSASTDYEDDHTDPTNKPKRRNIREDDPNDWRY